MLNTSRQQSAWVELGSKPNNGIILTEWKIEIVTTEYPHHKHNEGRAKDMQMFRRNQFEEEKAHV